MKFNLAILYFGILIVSCPILAQDKTNGSFKTHNLKSAQKNRLSNETSPYLLQHQHNPVDWYPWGEEAFEKAKKENKLLLISIGYSACHWCHVMEYESFEDQRVAEVMNNNFVCVKVDREERPDVDQIYMSAVQLMTKSGGWPLNCFALPDGRPVYGGTYFRKSDWLKVLAELDNKYRINQRQFERYAENLTQGIEQTQLLPKLTLQRKFDQKEVHDLVENWSKEFDHFDGGPNRAPKFPLPNNYLFLLRYARLSNNSSVEDFVILTLNKMAMGGIYDQVGGGFARYSTDGYWKVPHFEKMLYDNAQLLELYSEAFLATKNPMHERVIRQTIEFLERELRDSSGGFYSALDADSEGEEGKFYVWSKTELKEVLGNDYGAFANYYDIGRATEWEGHHILLRTKTDQELIASGESLKDLYEWVDGWNAKLLKVRENRIRPGLDDKILTSWNGMLISGYVASSKALDEPKYLRQAEQIANFILKTMRKEDCGLFHSYKDGVAKIDGFLEDYCFTIDGLIGLYQATLEVKWLKEAKALTSYVMDQFYDENSGLFDFTSRSGEKLVAKSQEIHDNVNPASNSSLAKCLFYLGHYFQNEHFSKVSDQMLSNVLPSMENYPEGHSNWAMLLLHHVYTYYDVMIVGKEAKSGLKELHEDYGINILVAGDAQSESIPLLKNKLIDGQTVFYVCRNNVCLPPISKAKEVLRTIHEERQ